MRQCVACDVVIAKGRRCGPCAVPFRAAKQLAHYFVQTAMRHGLLPSARTQTCDDCGKAAEFWDHRDYARPLHVAPVCRKCNFNRGGAVHGTSSLWSRHG